MAFESIRDCFAGRRTNGRPSAYPKDEIVFAIDKGSGKGQNRFCLRIAIHPEVAKKAKLIKGDVVDILFDKVEKAGLIKRVLSGGWKLTSGDSQSRLNVKTNYKPGMPSINGSTSCPCEITDDGILFYLPENVCFERNLREEAMKSQKVAK